MQSKAAFEKYTCSCVPIPSQAFCSLICVIKTSNPNQRTKDIDVLCSAQIKKKREGWERFLCSIASFLIFNSIHHPWNEVRKTPWSHSHSSSSEWGCAHFSLSHWSKFVPRKQSIQQTDKGHHSGNSCSSQWSKVEDFFSLYFDLGSQQISWSSVLLPLVWGMWWMGRVKMVAFIFVHVHS